MGIVALSLVVLLVERAPLGLEVEHVEVRVLCHEVDDSGFDVADGVGERAVFAIVTLIERVWELGAKFSLVFLNVVETLHLVVSHRAFILLWTAISLCFFAQVRLALSVLSPLVFD